MEGDLRTLVTIYALCDPDTGQCRYIGKANDLEARIRCHRWEARSSKLHTRKINWLRSLGGREPKVEVLEIVPYEQWAEAERRWIANLRAKGEDLTNFADGGQTSPVEGRGHTEATKQKLREASLRNRSKPPSRAGTTPWNKGKRGTCRPSSGQSGNRIAWNKGIRKIHCPQDHAYSPENTRIVVRRDGRSHQQCKRCARAQQKASLQRLATSGG